MLALPLFEWFDFFDFVLSKPQQNGGSLIFINARGNQTDPSGEGLHIAMTGGVHG